MPSKNLTVGQCELCDSRVEILGPMWLAPIHDPQFINLTKTSLGSMNHYFGTKDRIEGLLSVASEVSMHLYDIILTLYQYRSYQSAYSPH